MSISVQPNHMKQLPAPTSKRPEEWEFVVDSGASVHMMSKKRLKLRTDCYKKRSRLPTVVMTANVEVHILEEAQVFVHDLNQFVTVELLEENACCLTARQALQNGESIICKTFSYLLSFQAYLSILEVVSILQRYHRNHSNEMHDWSLETGLYQVHLRIHYFSEMTNLPQGNLDRNLWAMTSRMQRIRRQICPSGCRISQIIWKYQKCLHQHTVFGIQIRNILRKWSQNWGSTVFIHTFRKTELATYAWGPKLPTLLAEDALAKLHFVQKSLVTW